MNPVTTDLSLLTLISQASFVVKAVLAILVILSLVSWSVIFQKYFVVSKADRQIRDFENRFWYGNKSMVDLQTEARKAADEGGPLARIFCAGMSELSECRNKGIAQPTESTARAMRAAFNREIDTLERGLPLLASIGSTSPYIGLFGTVWGVMNAFTGLSSLENVSLAVVAPGIAEALIATAIGLFAAIPAFAAYNYYGNRVNRLVNRLESFHEEYLNIIERQTRS